MNVMTQHTPGPWNIDDGDSDAFGIFDDDGHPIAYLSERPLGGMGIRGRLVDKANATLMAAAPDLLETLIKLREGNFPGTPINAGSSAMMLIEETIFKATSERIEQ